MLTQRDQYETITIPYTMQIDGGILPLRDGDDKHILRGEDICYLAELANRWVKIANDFYYSTQKITSIDHVIYGWRYQSIIRWLKTIFGETSSYRGKPVYSTATWEPYYVHQGYSIPSAPLELNPDASKPDTLESDLSAFGRGQPLKIEPLSTLYEDIKLVDQVQAYYYQTTTFSGMSWETRTSGSYSGRDRTPYNNQIYAYHADEVWQSGGTWSWEWKMWSPESGPDKIYSVTSDKLKYMADDAKIILEFQLTVKHYTDADHYNWQTQSWVYHFPLTCLKTGGGYRIQMTDIINTVTLIRNRHNLGPSQTPNPAGYSQDGSAGAYDAVINLRACDWGLFKMTDDMEYDNNGN